MGGKLVIAGNRRGVLSMDINNKGNTVAQSKCKFYKKDIVQNIVHEICQNPEMLAINKREPAESLHCIGEKCGKASFD